MSDTDPQQEAEAAESTDEGAIDYPGDATDFAAEESETGPIGEETDEASEEEGTDEASSEEDVPDWFSQLSEEQQTAAKQYAQSGIDKSVNDLKSGWQTKLDDAAGYRKTVEAFDERVKTDLPGLIADLQATIPEKPAEPEGPGDMPDVLQDPEGFSKWMDARFEYARQTGAKEAEEKMAPALQLAQAQQVTQQRAAIQKALEANDQQMTEITEIETAIRKSPEAGYRILQEVVRLRAQVAGKKKANAAAVKEAQDGSEESPGLPRTGAQRPRPKPTGDAMTDTIAENKHLGIGYPGD